MTQIVEQGDKSGTRAGWGAVVFLAALFAVLAFGWSGILSLPVAWGRDEYSHGWLIPPIALYLFLRRADLFSPSLAKGPGWPALALGTLSLCIILLGNLALVPDIVTYGVIGFLLALAMSAFGLRGWLWYLVPLIYLGFMLPLPNFLYLRLSITLQLLSSQIGVGVIRLFGVPVFLEGNVIDLGVYQLQVAEACSGLRYLFPLASFGFLFGVLYRGPWWHKAILFLSTVPITVLMNAVRIGAIGVLVDRYGIEQAEGFLHAFEGWVIFAACIGIIFLEVMLLQFFNRPRLPVAEVLDIEMVPLLAQIRAVLYSGANRAMVVLAALALLFAAAWNFFPERRFERVEREVFADFPLTVGGQQGFTQDLTLDVETTLGADDYFLAQFASPAEPAGVGLFMAFYHQMTDGSGVHSPEVCLPTGGWEVSDWKTRRIAASGASIEVNRAIIQQGLSRQLVYYWFEQHGRRTTSSYALKYYTLIDAIRQGRTDAAIVRLVTPILQGEGEAAADERLRVFMDDLLPLLPPFVPSPSES